MPSSSSSLLFSSLLLITSTLIVSQKIGTIQMNLHQFARWGSIKMGDQTFQVAFNIASTNSWLIAKNASFNWNEQGLQRKKVRYNGNSKTSKSLGKKFDFGGPVGNLYTDTLTIDSVQIPQFTFGVVTSGIPSQYQDPSGYDALCPIDGEFGLSPATGTSTLNSLTKYLDKPIVSIFTTKVGTGDDNAGSITFGSENVKNCKPKYSYVPLAERSNWVIGIQSININGQPSINPLGPTKLKITNSGLYMYGPKKQLDILAKQLGFNVPKDSGTFYTKGSCKEMEKMPNIIINVGDNKKQAQIVLKPKQYMEVSPIGECRFLFMASETYASPGDNNYWSMGAQFLLGRCVAVNWVEGTMGFSDAN
uniref:Peptidase A1 domain-containing protein n=1 Tax=Meloidogyne incognita TaxID=6306 RepID=A0A914L1I3_MELIC